MVARLRLFKDQKPPKVPRPEAAQTSVAQKEHKPAMAPQPVKVDTMKVQRLRRLTALLKSNAGSTSSNPTNSAGSTSSNPTNSASPAGTGSGKPPTPSLPTPPIEIFTSDMQDHCDDASLVTMSTWASYSTMPTLTSPKKHDPETKDVEPIPEKIVAERPLEGAILRILPMGERRSSGFNNQRQDEEEAKQREIDDLMEAYVRTASQAVVEESKEAQENEALVYTVPASLTDERAPTHDERVPAPTPEDSVPALTTEERRPSASDMLKKSLLSSSFSQSEAMTAKVANYDDENQSLIAEAAAYTIACAPALEPVRNLVTKTPQDPEDPTDTKPHLTQTQMASNSLFKGILRWMVVYGGSHQKDASKRLLEKAEASVVVEDNEEENDLALTTSDAPSSNMAANFWQLHSDIMLDPAWRVMQETLDAAGIDITDKASIEMFLRSHPECMVPFGKKAPSSTTTTGVVPPKQEEETKAMETSYRGEETKEDIQHVFLNDLMGDAVVASLRKKKAMSRASPSSKSVKKTKKPPQKSKQSQEDGMFLEYLLSSCMLELC